MRKKLRPEDLGDLLTAPRIAVMATQNADGSTLLAPVWHEWMDGGFSIVIDGNDPKARNLQRDARVSVVVAEDDPPYRGIEVRGEAKFPGTSAVPLMQRLAGRYLAKHDAAAYLARMQEWTDEAIVLRVEPGALRAWDFADEPW